MSTLKSIFLISAVFASPIWAQQGNDFQGLAWNSSISSIKNKFPDAKQGSPSTKKYPICKKPDGTIYDCSVEQQMCEKHGHSCYPSLKINNYMVGNYPFDLTFELSKNATLSGVVLTFSGDLIGKNRERGKLIFDHLMDSLGRKYGPPIVVEAYVENPRDGFFGAGYKWQTGGSRINLNYHGQVDQTTRNLARGTITIIYSPLIDDFSSKL